MSTEETVDISEESQSISTEEDVQDGDAKPKKKVIKVKKTKTAGTAPNKKKKRLALDLSYLTQGVSKS